MKERKDIIPVLYETNSSWWIFTQLNFISILCIGFASQLPFCIHGTSVTWSEQRELKFTGRDYKSCSSFPELQRLWEKVYQHPFHVFPEVTEACGGLLCVGMRLHHPYLDTDQGAPYKSHRRAKFHRQLSISFYFVSINTGLLCKWGYLILMKCRL